MTDSMKFGPEWLRNMADSGTPQANFLASNTTFTSASNNNSCSSNPNTCHPYNASLNGVVSGSGGMTNTATQSFCGNGLTSTQQRNLPEFRYGREEMLSLFDRNCNVPEILPSFKKIFVEKVQFPLALTPTPDDEITQVGVLVSQRPAWMQRSPVGFSNSARGSGLSRGGLVDRGGRMRGKPIFHSMYQRSPGGVYEDDLRPMPLKTERGWLERNGSGVDTLNSAVTGSSGSGGVVGGPEWNSPPSASPRKEFGSISRNMENWRRQRNEESGNAANSGVVSGGGGTCESANGANVLSGDGWRGGSSTNFGNSHRWTRSTSWRDEDENGNYGGGSGGGSAFIMQRSFSNIAPTASERAGTSSGSFFTSNSGGGPGSSNTSSAITTNKVNSTISICGIRQNANASWSNNTIASGSTPTPLGSSTGNVVRASAVDRSLGNFTRTDADDMLPEWAMENTTEVSGGTFDATGAFHGSSANEIESEDHASKEHRSQSPTKSREEMIAAFQEHYEQMSLANITKETDGVGGRGNQTTTVDTKILNDDKTCISTEDILPYQCCEETQVHSAETTTYESNNCVQLDDSKGVPLGCRKKDTSDLLQEPTIEELREPNEFFADRMKEVADDMVEKLIMDDEIDSRPSKRKGLNSRTTIAKAAVETAEKISPPHHHQRISERPHQSSTNMADAVNPLDGAAGMVSVILSPVLAVANNGKEIPPQFTSENRPLPIPAQRITSQQPLHNQQLLPTTLVLPAAASLAPAGTSDLWYYRDPQSKVQGPFTPLEMTEWYRAGYFNENLYVRRGCDARFRPLGELTKLCHGNMPFSHTFLIPPALGLERSASNGLHFAAAAAAAVTNAVTALPHRQHHANHNEASNKQAQLGDLKSGPGLSLQIHAVGDVPPSAAKNLFNAVDVSNILNMHFKYLQEQYIRHHERVITVELTSHEWYQRMTPNEREAIVRQKVQSLDLPEYLTSLSALGNSLAKSNPAAYMQLYEAIRTVHLQQNESLAAVSNNQFFLGAEAATILHNNVQQHQPELEQLAFVDCANMQKKSLDRTARGSINEDSTDLMDDYNLRLFLQGAGRDCNLAGVISADDTNSPQLVQQKQQQKNFLNLQHDFLNPGPADSNSFPANAAVPNIGSANSYVGMWMAMPTDQSLEQSGSNNHVCLQNKEQKHHMEGQPGKCTQWTGPLVGIPSSVIDHAPFLHDAETDGIRPLNGTSMSSVNVSLSNWEADIIRQNDSGNDDEKQTSSLPKGNLHIQKTPKTSPTVVTKEEPVQLDKISTVRNTDCEEQPTNFPRSRKDDHKQPDKHSRRNNNSGSTVRNNNVRLKFKEDESDIGRNGLERRNEDDKRKQKEERKRQHLDEDRRRQQLADDEKRRQQLEEKERQHLIQSQRRKAMLGGNNSASVDVEVSCSISGVGVIANNTNAKQQHRMPLSIAPWSLQTADASKGVGPCLAEIQKAERRERRADQQRQSELLEKQIRASTADVSDVMVKWNASPVPVKSLAEIQAEESKRLVAEQMEQQRRKETDQQAALAAIITTGGPHAALRGRGVVSSVTGGAISSGLATGNNVTIGGTSMSASIWSSNKIWGNSSANLSSVFWEESPRFSVVAGTASNNTTIGSSNTLSGSTHAMSANYSEGKSTQSVINLPPMHTPEMPVASVVGATGDNARNLRKSHTMPVVQRPQSGAVTIGSATKNPKHQSGVIAPGMSTTTPAKQINSKMGGSQVQMKDSVDKRNNNCNVVIKHVGNNNVGGSLTTSSSVGIASIGNSNGGTNCSNKHNDNYGNEFTIWCTKSLYTLTTKVDVPTFVTFLQDLESPYEVKDYIRMYLGENKEFAEFGKQFLERRSKYKSIQRAQNAHNDDMCKPAPAITPLSLCGDNSDHKGKMRKIKKNKMTKLDARILGFSVTAAEGRINVGDRDYVDAP